MRAADLDLRELLSFEPKGGILRFADQRALLFDAVALGLLRRELIGTLGPTGARALLTRFGYAHGWRTAETLKEGLPWESEEDWRRAGGFFHMLQGYVRVEPSGRSGDGPKPIAEAVWQDSYEAEQHLLHLGRADEPVCWTLTGYASGYLSHAYGREIYCIEERCRGRGDAVCQLVGRPLEEWGAAFDQHLPFYKMACLEASLQQVTEELKQVEKRLRARKSELESASTAQPNPPTGLIAQSAAMQRVLDLARRVAQVDSTVLLTGESGVGKERIARLIHRESTRMSGPFVAINCGALPEHLLESELFGHVRGAFSGAIQDRVGLFEAANGGTLLLDEIGEISPALQVKLLRVLQEREVRRVGENRGRPLNVRLLAATNRDLAEATRNASFRQDLYFRLHVIEIRVPALRERHEDILPLARNFLALSAKGLGHRALGFTPGAAQRLLSYNWPGNVRELENAMERAAVLSTKSRIDVDDLPQEVGQTVSSSRPGELRSLAEVERDTIKSVLEACGGNRGKAATALGIGVATLYRKLKSFDTAT